VNATLPTPCTVRRTLSSTSESSTGSSALLQAFVPACEASEQRRQFWFWLRKNAPQCEQARSPRTQEHLKALEWAYGDIVICPYLVL
jgi:hypothetical protein